MNDLNNNTVWIYHYGKALGAVDIIHVTDTYETYGTYVDDKSFDKHDYDDDTDDDTDNNTGDDTDDDIYTLLIVFSI